MGVKLDHQQALAVEELGNGKVLVGGVGSGKSITSLAYFMTKICQAGDISEDIWRAGHAKSICSLYIITTARKRDSGDWDVEASRFGISTDSDISMDGIQVTVDSWNNIKQYTTVRDAFFIFDEQRLVGNGVWVKSFYEIAKHNRWILLSATPGDRWHDYIPLFIANHYYPNKTAFEQRHVVYKRFSKFPQVERYLFTDELTRIRDELLVEMPVARHTVRHEEVIKVSYDRWMVKEITKTRFNPVSGQPIRNAAEFCQVIRRIVLMDPSRQAALIELLRDHPKAVIFYNYDYELEALRALLGPLKGTLAEWNGHVHEDVPDGSSWVYLVQYTAGSEAWNCTTTDTIIFFSLNYSYKIMEQSKGRIDRLNTPYTDLYYYSFISPAWIDKAVAKAVDEKRVFSESAYGRKFVR